MRIGSYEVEEELGRGATAAVYRAVDVRTGRQAALKLMLQPLEHDEVRRRRFWREVQALQHVQHPGVVRVYEAGEVQGRGFLAMEYVEGETLERRVERAGPLTPGQAAELGRALAGALQAAHEQGVAHRDLKPANVLFDRAGVPKIADFGLAKALGVEMSRLTRSGAFHGTPGYMAPEQARGDLDQVGPWTDVYGLGATLYYALVGRPPIEGETLAQVIVRTDEDPPRPLRELRADVPAPLEGAIARCLAKPIEGRFESALELELSLQRLLDGGDASPPRGSGWGRWAAAVCAVGGVVAAVGGWRAGWEAPVVVEVPETVESGAPEVVVEEVRVVEGAEELPGVRAEEVARLREAVGSGSFAEALGRAEGLLARAPERGELWALRGEALVGLARTGEALEAFREASVRAPESVGISVRLASLLNERGAVEEALGVLDGVLAREPTSLAARLERGEVLAKQRQWEQARRDFERVVRDHPEAPEGWLNLAHLERQQGRLEASMEAARRGLEVDPQSWALHYELGHCASALGDFGLASDAFAEVVGRQPRHHNAWVLLGIARHRGGRPGAAEALDRGLEGVPHDALGRTVRAHMYYAEGDLVRAQVLVEAVLRDVPTFGDALNLGGMIALDQGRMEEARGLFERALRLDTDEEVVLYNLAFLAYAERDYVESLRLVEQLLRLSPGDLQYRRSRASLLNLTGSPEASLAAYDAILGTPGQSAEDLAMMHARRGEVRRQLGELEAATRDVGAALRLVPGLPDAIGVRALVHFDEGRLEEARRDARFAASEIEPPNSLLDRLRPLLGAE